MYEIGVGFGLIAAVDYGRVRVDHGYAVSFSTEFSH